MCYDWLTIFCSYSVEQDVIREHLRATVLAHPGGCVHRALQYQLRTIIKWHLIKVYQNLYTKAAPRATYYPGPVHNLLKDHLFLRAVFSKATLQFSYFDLKSAVIQTQTSKRKDNWHNVGFHDPEYISKRILIKCEFQPNWFLRRLDNEVIRNLVVSAVITHDELPSASVAYNDTVEPVYELQVDVRDSSYKWHPELTYPARAHATGACVVNPSPLWQCAKDHALSGVYDDSMHGGWGSY